MYESSVVLLQTVTKKSRLSARAGFDSRDIKYIKYEKCTIRGCSQETMSVR